MNKFQKPFKRLIVILLLAIFLAAACQFYPAIPQARHGAKMVYDPEGEQMLLFGGRGNGSIQGDLFNDLWAFDLENQIWREITSSSPPSPRLSPGMVYDPDRHQIILFGGYGKRGRLNDTWLFDLGSYEWEEIHPEISPPARSDLGMAFDGLNQVAVMFGGYCLDHQRDYCGDTWYFDPGMNSWREVFPVESPPVMYGHSLNYDSQNGKFLLWGGHMSDFDQTGMSSAGYNGSIWSYSVSDNEWLEILPGSLSRPGARYWHQAAFVSGFPGLCIFSGDGGYGYLKDSWFFNAGDESWTRIRPEQIPPARIVGAMEYSPDFGQIVLFGGLDNDFANLNDTWIYVQASGEWQLILP